MSNAHKKLRVVVVSGGPSSEHEVSLASAKNVLGTIDKNKYEAFRCFIDKKGEWECGVSDLRKRADLAFICLHGTYGEDGTVQSFFEEANLPYTGSDPLASALAMNKFLSARVLSHAGFHVPRSFLLQTHDWPANQGDVHAWVKYYGGDPLGAARGEPVLVVKPNNDGSSVGVSLVKNAGELDEAIWHALKVSREVLVQPYIKGKEITCGVLDHGTPESAYPLLPTEIIPRGSTFFDYRAKYEPGAAYEITPPPGMPEALVKKIQRTAVAAHRALGCRGFSRTDIILDERGNLYVLEVNTIPGLTTGSLLPKAAEASGITFAELLDRVILSALR